MTQIHGTAQTEWQVLNSSKVEFKIKNAGLNVNGSFASPEASVLFSAEALGNSKITASVDASSVDTGINARDNHLRKDDYFGVKKYPKIKMVSQRFEQKGDEFIGYFKLTIRDVSQEVAIPFSFDESGDKAVFKGSFSINRRDFGVGGWSMILGNEVDLSILLRVQKK